jgi:hypothetical protein
MAKKRPKMSEADLDSAIEVLKKEFETLTIEENQMAKSKAKAKTEGSVKKLSDKLTKVNENFTINMYDNGYMIEVSGRDDEDNWKTSKIIVDTVEELLVLVREATEIERAE